MTLPHNDTAPPQAAPVDRRIIFLMACACAVSVANIYYCQPLLSDFARIFHVGTDRAGLIATTAQFGYGLGLFLFLPLGDIVERKTVILAMSVVCSALLSLTALSNSFSLLVIAQIVMGATSVGAQLLIPLAVDMSPPEKRGSAVGSLMAGVLTGILLARTLSGFVGEYLGWRSMYWLAAAMTLGMATLLYVVLPKRPPTMSSSYGRLMFSMWGLVRSQPKLRNASFVSGCSLAAFSAFWAVLSFLMRDQFHQGAAEAGLFGLIGMGGAVCAPFLGKLSDRSGPVTTLAVAMGMQIAAFLLMGAWVSWAGLVIGVTILDMGVQSVQIAAQAEVMALVPEARSRLNSIYMAARFAGGATGTILATTAYALAGWKGACGVCVAELLLGAAAHLAFHRKRSA